jgi:hypothetical protein
VTGSSTESDCFPAEEIAYNLFTVMTIGGLLTYSKQAGELESIEAGAALASPESLMFISSSNMLISSFESSEVREQERVTERSLVPKTRFYLTRQLS